MVDKVSTVTGLPGQPQPEEEEIEQAATVTQPIATGAVPVTSGIPTPVAGGGISAAAPREAGFVSAQKLVAANLPQTRQLAERVGQRLEQTAQEARGAITQAGQAFQQQVQAGLPTGFQTIQGQETAEQFLTRALAAPTTLSEQERQQFSDVTTGAFGGPQTFEAGEQFIPLSQQVTEAQRLAGLTGTSIGRRELLLGDQSGRVRSRGVRALDELLLGATPESAQRLQQAAGQFTDIPQLLQQTTEAGTAFAGQRAEELDIFQQQALERLGGARTDITSGLEQRVIERQQAATTQADAIRESIRTGQPIDAEQAAILGLTREQAVEFNAQLPQLQAIQRLAGSQDILTGDVFGATALTRDGPSGGVGGIQQTALNIAVPRLLDAGLSQQDIDAITGQDLFGNKFIDTSLISNLPPNQQLIVGQTLFQAQSAEGLGRLGQFSGVDPLAFDINPEDFLTQLSPETAFTQQTVATQEEIARLEALRQLGGIEDPLSFISDPSLIGTAPEDLLDFRGQDIIGQISGLIGSEGAQNLIGRAREEFDLNQQDIRTLASGELPLFSTRGQQFGTRPLTTQERQQLEERIQGRQSLLLPFQDLLGFGG